jgi:hypothetical protein
VFITASAREASAASRDGFDEGQAPLVGDDLCQMPRLLDIRLSRPATRIRKALIVVALLASPAIC